MHEHDEFRVFDALPSAAFVTGPGGEIIFGNAHWRRYTGRSTERPAPGDLLDVVHPDDRAAAAERWRRSMRDAASWEAECRLRRADGEYRWHLCRAEPDATGSKRWFGTCVDIHERRSADDAKAWLAAIVADSDDAIVSKTLDGTIRSWNLGAERTFGHSAAEAIGQSIALIIPADRLDEERSILERLRRGERIEHLETERVTGDGRRISISLTVSPVRDGEGRLIGASKVARDITERKRAAAALQDSKAKLNTIVERLPIGLMVADHAGRILSLNPAGQTIHGLEPDADLLVPLEDYRALYELRQPDGTPIPLDDWPVNRAARGEFVTDAEVLVCRPDGTQRLILYTTVPLPDQRGDDLLMFVMQDITNRRRMERALAASRAQLRLITDHSAVMLAHCDPDGRYLFVNRTYAERFGLDAEQMIGRLISEVIGARAYAVIDPYVQRVLKGELVEFEAELPYTGLGRRYMHCVYVPEFDETHSKVRSFVGAISDITERKQLEDELVEADRRKDEFLAILGHELRNPLAPLSTGLELLRQAADDPRAIAGLRPVMQRQLAHLVRLVDDLVDVSRISRGLIQIQRATVDLQRVISDGVELARPLIDERGHRLVIEQPTRPEYVAGDRERLTQVVSNLLTNAAKYMRPGGSIRVWTQPQQQSVALHVSDTGLGIAADRLQVIFEMFSQIPEHRQHVSGGGLGIGLALSRQLIELHGGSIEARSPGPGEGSEFLVTLPLVQAPAPSPAGDTTGSRATSRRILVVDDNVDAADGLRTLLGFQGHDVRAAYDGAEALAVMRSFPADVVLLDIGLPQLDGYEVARRIRKMPGGQDVLLIALTGWGQEEARHRSEAAGFDEHLTKPVDPNLLMRLLES